MPHEGFAPMDSEGSKALDEVQAAWNRNVNLVATINAIKNLPKSRKYEFTWGATLTPNMPFIASTYLDCKIKRLMKEPESAKLTIRMTQDGVYHFESHGDHQFANYTAETMNGAANKLQRWLTQLEEGCKLKGLTAEIDRVRNAQAAKNAQASHVRSIPKPA